MHPRRTGLAALLAVVTIALGSLLACVLLVFGVANLIHPDVYPAYLARNTWVCGTLILTAAVIVYALFRPLAGGIGLIACGAVFVFLMPGPFSVPNPVAVPILLLAGLSVARGLVARPRAPEDLDQAT